MSLHVLIAMIAGWIQRHQQQVIAYLVRSKYSCGLAVLVLQEPPEPLSASDWAISRTFRTRRREGDNIALALVRTFCMIMLDVLAQNMRQRTFTKQNHP